MPETKVVIKNFQKICGLLGAPGSSPSLTFSGFVLVIFIGKEIKKISHQISRKMIIEPVNPNFKLLIFADYDASFDNLLSLLKEFNLNYFTIKGASSTICKNIDNYKSTDISKG